MDLKNTIYTYLPQDIRTILYTSKGWLVGGAIPDIIKKISIESPGLILPNDWDIIVPDRQLFQETVKWLTMASPAKPNTFGGLKFKSKNKIDIDIWCEELNHFLCSNAKTSYCYNLASGVLLTVNK